MHYIVGLGNPGKQYEDTRHNVGFLLLARFVEAAQLPSLYASAAYSGLVSQGVFEEQEVTVLLPQTYMNASGSAVKKLVPTQDAPRLIVVYDDIDIPLGDIKVSFGRGDGGHNGIKSIIEALGSKEFARVRVGIGHKSIWTGKLVRPKGQALSSYVLGKFSSKEHKQLQAVEQKMLELFAVFVTKGSAAAMNAFNER